MPYRQKTMPTSENVAAYLAAQPAPRDAEGAALDALFREVTGFQPTMWGQSLIGYGQYAYTYASGHSGVSLATGFAPRQAKISVYIMPGYGDFSEILGRLGPHSLGKSCLYITRLSRIDLDVLGELVAAGLNRLGEIWPVTPSPEGP